MLTIQYAFTAPAAALIVSAALLAWLVRRPTLMADIPNERSLHAPAVPRTGGIAIVRCALSASSFLPGAQALVAMAAGIAVVSLADDWRSLPVVARLGAHFLIAIGFVATVLTHVSLAEAILFVVALVWLANLYNFMDGSDGLAGGMAVIGFGNYALVAVLTGNPVFAA